MKKTVKAAALVMMTLLVGICAAGAYLPQSATQVSAATLKKGSTGSAVRTMQQKLKNWGYYTGSVDGIFGSKTLEAVKYFQRKNGLSVDGIVGVKTLAALGMSSGSGDSGVTGSYSSSDVALLARLIYGEARGESYVGQVAVGAVVMIRIKSPSFPKTISGVGNEQDQKSIFSEHHVGRNISEIRFYRGGRRADKSHAGRYRQKGRAGRHERLGSDLRRDILL